MSYTREGEYRNLEENNSRVNSSLLRQINSIQINNLIQQKFKRNLKIINKISPGIVNSDSFRAKVKA